MNIKKGSKTIKLIHSIYIVYAFILFMFTYSIAEDTAYIEYTVYC